MVGALDPALLESMTIVPGTRRDSIEGEDGKNLRKLKSRLIQQKEALKTSPGQIGGSLKNVGKRWGSWVKARRC